MPTSIYSYLPTFAEFLREIRPSSLLDVGMGNGKLGFIAREILDTVFNGRYRSTDWKIQIDGIEIFPDYIQQHQKAIYDHIYLGNALDILPRLGRHDLLILGDVLEHFDKTQGWQLMDRSIEKTNHHLILNVPLGSGWNQGEMYGNPYECHCSEWQWEEFSPFVWQYKFFGDKSLQYGTFLIRRKDYLRYKEQNAPMP